MELDPIGRVDDPSELDLEPVTIPVIGYTLDGKEVVEKARFRPMAPAGQTVAVLRVMAPNGGVPVAQMMEFLDACVLEDGREAWGTFLERPDVEIEQVTLVRVYSALMEAYAARPTLPPASSAGGGEKTKQTSQAAVRAKASRSKKSRLR